MATMTKATLRTVVDVEELGQDIFLYRPQIDDPGATDGKEEEDNKKPPPPPSLVILCTWLGGATARRIDKYIIKYRRLFPRAYILLIQTTMLDYALRPFKLTRARLAPARDAIRKILSDRDSVVVEDDYDDDGPRSDGRILLHLFSHGGCNMGIQLALSMREEDGVPPPLGAIILDCCPGDATFQKAYDAAVLSLPRGQPAQALGRLALYPAVAAITGLQHFGVMSSVSDMRDQLNDSTIFGSRAARLYLYSAADQMVDWHHVRSHMEAARAKGYWVDGVMFRSSPHCALILEDEVRYCAAIKNFWQLSHPSCVDGAAATTTTTTQLPAASASTTTTTENHLQNVTASLPPRGNL